MIGKEMIVKDLEDLRNKAPLVHNITNYVVMNVTANALLSVGASPVMAHANEEVEEMVSISSALMLNIGTLSEKWIEAMFTAGKKAKEVGVPVVLDPVGAGATALRTETANRLIEKVQPDIIRGNASEVMALLMADAKTKGVDSSSSSEDAIGIAKEMAAAKNCIVSVSGKIDYITDGNRLIAVNNGHPLMGKIVGTGCMASSLTAAFAGVHKDYFRAAVDAMVTMGVAGELAGKSADAPAAFQMQFLDDLYRLDKKALNEYAEFNV